MSATSAPKARTVFGMKWYPMTLRPAAPYALVMAGFYYAMTQFDAKIRAGKNGKSFIYTLHDARAARVAGR
jgi:hypothetical protein